MARAGVKVCFQSQSGLKTVWGDRDRVHRMLEMFYPVEGKSNERLRSVGLGLGMCRSTMEQYGGTLRLEIDPIGNSRISALFHGRAREHA